MTATDISAEMIAFGRERAAAAGFDNIEFVESDASALDFPEGSFDAALSRWGSSSSPTARPPWRGFGASSSLARELRSAPGDRRIAFRSLRFR